MKRLLLILLLLPGCAGWSINGVPADRFRHMEAKEYAQVAGGIGASFLTHWIGHAVYLEAESIEWNQDGFTEWFNTDNLPGYKRQMVGRSGFLMQLLIGTGLKFSPWKTSLFATGYHACTAAEIISYSTHFHRSGDFFEINEGGGKGDLEYFIYSMWTGFLLIP